VSLGVGVVALGMCATYLLTIGSMVPLCFFLLSAQLFSVSRQATSGSFHALLLPRDCISHIDVHTRVHNWSGCN